MPEFAGINFVVLQGSTVREDCEHLDAPGNYRQSVDSCGTKGKFNTLEKVHH